MGFFTAIGAAIGGALFTGAAAKVAGTIIAGALSFGARLAFSYINRPKARTYTAISGNVEYGGETPASTILGRGKTRGQKVYFAKYGDGNAFNTEVFVLADGWCDGLEPYVFFFGKKHNLISMPVTGNEVAAYYVEDYVRNGNQRLIEIRFFDGRPGQGHATQLVAATAHLGDQKWLPTSTLDGKCYVVVQRRYSTGWFAGKGVPEIEFVLRGLRCYDFRKDSTIAGGFGPHRLGDLSTYEFSENPAVLRLNYQLGIRAPLSDAIIIGEGRSLGQIDLESYRVAMNVCDETRTVGERTFARYSAVGLIVNSDDDHTEVIAELDDAMAAYSVNRRGLSGVIVGAPQVVSSVLTEDDIPAGRSVQVQLRKPTFELYNMISGQYISKEDLWEPKSLKVATSPSDVAEDGERRQAKNDFLQIQDPDIAQYLLNVRYRQNRLGGLATVPVSQEYGFARTEGEWIEWRGRTWMISNWSASEDLDIELTLTEVDDNIYDEGDIPVGPVELPSPDPINPDLKDNVQNFAVEVGTIAAPDGAELPALRFSWTPPDDESVTQVVFEYFPGLLPPNYGAGERPFVDATFDPEAGEYITTKNVQQGLYYTARPSIRTQPDRFRQAAPWIVTQEATSDFSLNVSVLDGSITAAKIADAAVTAEKLMNEAVTELKLADRAVANVKIQLAAVDASVTADLAMVTAKLADNAATLAKIAPNAVDGSKLVDLSVATGELANQAVVNAKIGPLAVDAAKLADSAVTNLKLGPLAVQAANLATNAVTETKIADNSITTPKLTTNAVVADKIAARAVSSEKLIISNFEDLIENGNFLSDTVGWTIPSGVGVVTRGQSSGATSDPSAPTEKMLSLSNVQTTPQYVGNAKTTPVKPGDKFYASYWAAAGGSGTLNGDIRLRVRFYLADGTSTYSDAGIGTPISQAWQRFGGEVTAPAGAQFARVDLLFIPGATTTRIYFASSISVIRKSAGELIVDGSISAEKIAADSIFARHIVLGDISNMLIDSSFEDPLAWNYSSNALSGVTFENNPIAAAQGRTVVFDVGAGANNTSYWGEINTKDLINVEPGKQYNITYSRCSSTSAFQGTLDIRALFYDRTGTGALLSTAVTGGISNVPTTAAQTITQIVTAPAGAVYMRLVLRQGTSVNAGKTYMWNVVVRRAASAEMIVDGAILADKLAANSVDATKVVANSLTANELAANSVAASELAANSVIAGKVAADAIVAASIATGAVTADALATNSVTAIKIAASTITGDKVAANTLTGDKLVVNTITARELILTDFANLVPDPHYQTASLWNYSIQPGWNILLSTGTATVEAWGVKSKGTIYYDGSTSSAGLSEVVRSSRFPVEDNQSYNVTYEARRFNSGTTTVQLVARCYDRIGTQIAYTVVGGTDITTTSSVPIERSVTFTPPVGTVEMTIGLRWNGATSTSGFILGYISVRPMRGAELIVDGGITASKLAVDSVTADKINVTSLAAISATLGSVNISSAVIGTLQVGTSNISPGAITAIFTAGPYSGSGTSMQLDLTVNHGANAGELIVTMCGIGVAEDAAGSLRARGIRAGGTAFTCVASGIQLNSGQTYTFPISQTFRYTPPAANTSTAISFIIDRSAGGITTSANSMNIIVQQCKR